MTAAIDMKLEVVVIPVSDIDRSKRFYGGLGWRLDADFTTPDGFRVIQFTPPGSPCSIHFGTARPGVGSAAPGSAQGLYLVVSNVDAARADLIGRGVEVSEVFHRAGRDGRFSGPDPERRMRRAKQNFGSSMQCIIDTVRVTTRPGKSSAHSEGCLAVKGLRIRQLGRRDSCRVRAHAR